MTTGAQSNRDGIGAKVRVRVREATLGDGEDRLQLSFPERAAIDFWLGSRHNHGRRDRLAEWQDGRIAGLAANQAITFRKEKAS